MSLNDVAKICAGHIGDTCVITLLSEDGEWLDPVAFYNPDNEALEFAKIILPNSAYRLGQDLVSQTIRSRQPLLIPIIPQEKIRAEVQKQYWPWLDRFGVYSILIVPLLMHGYLVGTIGLSRDHPGNPYQDEDLVFLQDLADRIALAVQNVRLHTEIKQKSNQLERSNALISSLVQAAGKLLTMLDAEQIVQNLCDELHRKKIQSIIALFDHEQESLVFANSSIEPDLLKRISTLIGIPIQGLRLDRKRMSPLFSELFEKKQPLFIAEIFPLIEKYLPTIEHENLYQCVEWIGISTQTKAISIPMMLENRLIGLMTVWGDDLREEDLQVFSLFVSQTTIALENARLFEQVRHGRKRMQALSHQLVEISEKERLGIARELHDEIGQILTGLNLLLGISTKLPVDKMRNNLNDARAIVNDLMNKVHMISLDLRPIMLDDLGLLPALLWYTTRYTQQTDIQVILKQHKLSNRRFSPETEITAYRIIQESLTNVARHAGVKTVEVKIWISNKILSIQISDQGIGFDLQKQIKSYKTSGISGIEERANYVGGKLSITSEVGKGTHLLVELPVR